MKWNYRRMKIEGAELYQVREVYYDDDGNVTGYLSVPSVVEGESEKELGEVFGMIRTAFDAPVLDEAELMKELQQRKSAEGE